VSARNAAISSLTGLLLVAGVAGAAQAGERPKQAVLISFDGAQPIEQWQRSRQLGAVTGARFTYFLSCVFLLSPEIRSDYASPRHKAGRSNVGFAASTADVAARLSQVWTARAEGHEIASHGCGHFDGADWSRREWSSEFDSFTRILRDAWRLNGIAGEPAGWRAFATREIKGFRAPYLSVGHGLLPALAEHGFLYDASGVSRGPVPPADRKGVRAFSLPMIPEGPKGRRVIAMDYNLFVRHSGGFEREDADAVFEERTLAAFRDAFDAAIAGDRTPLQLGFHFTLMNGGAYWRALERFAREVCLREDVACISYADYLADGPGLDPTPGEAGG
jgi:peptidoglycan/xylan/chitin deacetylase (PgdA/CDA1 family)